jgi:hypothetical protein
MTIATWLYSAPPLYNSHFIGSLSSAEMASFPTTGAILRTLHGYVSRAVLSSRSSMMTKCFAPP